MKEDMNSIEYFAVPFNVTAMRIRDPRSLRFLRYFRDLKSLYISSGQINDLEELKMLHRLEELTLFDIAVKDISAVWEMNQLRSLYINECNDTISLSKLTELRELTVVGGDLKPSEPLQELVKIESLTLQACNLKGIRFVSGMKRLRELNIERNQVMDIGTLENLTVLENLVIATNNITDLSPLINLRNIHTLDISDNPICWSHCDLSKLSCLPSVRELGLSWISVNAYQLHKARELRKIHFGGVECNDISFLVNHPNVGKISLYGSTVLDISCLLTMPNLKSVWLSGNAFLKDDATVSKLRSSGVEVCESNSTT